MIDEIKKHVDDLHLKSKNDLRDTHPISQNIDKLRRLIHYRQFLNEAKEFNRNKK